MLRHSAKVNVTSECATRCCRTGILQGRLFSSSKNTAKYSVFLVIIQTSLRNRNIPGEVPKKKKKSGFRHINTSLYVVFRRVCNISSSLTHSRRSPTLPVTQPTVYNQQQRHRATPDRNTTTKSNRLSMSVSNETSFHKDAMPVYQKSGKEIPCHGWTLTGLCTWHLFISLFCSCPQLFQATTKPHSL